MNNHPFVQLVIVRIKAFYREPDAVFWTYGFPLLMVIGLGIAFRNKPEEVIKFDVVAGPRATQIEDAIHGNAHLQARLEPFDQAMDRLRKNKTPVVVEVSETGDYAYHFDPTNSDSRAARAAIDDALQRAAGRADAVHVEDRDVTAPGSRYVDFLVPGLIGMNLMGGGMWGIGFSLVDMRVRNLLKRLLATPMRRTHFMLSLVGMRAIFFVPEMAVLLLVAYALFKVPLLGSVASVVVVALIGSLTFAGLGLLVACRAKRIETVTGLMNLVMLPMWLMSGIFFSSERFPDFLQPFIKALPLTQLNNALRAVILDGDPVASQAVPLLILALWGAASFFLALRWFRWNE